ncbi:lytic murein transglycosylase [Martelella mediterranea]|uniref:Membrane-bound lytic murein transglycosylase B n=1 Tax=Martelella mediterranea DSM 17316 TaxID=1122214 RepID=A0A1U9Z264_9HYPH|nr:lytic murein transglycosylase [Martelella mediterranea]AQZ51781.1 Membrane-bound lytic murein transglycosylase B precursor [Martelella mediterranea DSM 17316]
MLSKSIRAVVVAAGLTSLFAGPVAAQQCGGDFGSFLSGVKAEAVQRGLSPQAADAVLSGASVNKTVLSRDRAQGVFKQTFLEFSQRTASNARLQTGKKKMQQYASTFDRARREFGVPAGVLTAFWAMETDFGAVQGDFNTRDALVTLSYDCRRPEIFRPQLIALIEMTQHGDFDPATETGAWAGELGQVQMLPEDIIRFGVDGDGDGHVRVKKSSPDALLTAANYIRSLGWRPGEPWIQEVVLPQSLPWDKTGFGGGLTAGQWFQLGVQPRDGNTRFANLPAALLMPQGRFGPSFLAYPNFNVYLEWNQSFIYTTSVAFFATRFEGAQAYDKGNPEQGLSDGQMKQLQQILASKGYDVGKIDGILGAGTRDAVRSVQLQLGQPADGWPTPSLLNAIR